VAAYPPLEMAKKEGDQGMVNEAQEILGRVYARSSELELEAIMYVA
jgi:predicted negative regulator of RcsB-dependent stress response